VADVVGVVVGLVVGFLVVVWPWVAVASAGGFDDATWQAVGRSKPAWFVVILLVPLASVGYWLLVRPQLRAARLRSAGAVPGGGPARG
jgi:hypothetical protein